jgi:hypothetical protein
MYVCNFVCTASTRTSQEKHHVCVCTASTRISALYFLHSIPVAKKAKPSKTAAQGSSWTLMQVAQALGLQTQAPQESQAPIPPHHSCHVLTLLARSCRAEPSLPV